VPARLKAAPAASLSLEGLVPPPPAGSQVLPVAIAMSLVLHAGLLLLKFAPPDGRMLENLAPPLEVVLVNSKSAQKPFKADALAQSDLDGGGNTELDRRAKTNLPVLPEDPSDEVSLAAQRVEEAEAKALKLLARLKSDKAVDPGARNRQKLRESEAARETPEAEQRRLEIARLEAQIARQMDHYQKLPKRKFVGARTEGVVYAQYVDDWRQRIEKIGTRNFPGEARRQGIFGSLLLTVSIRADGSLEKIEVDRSSGHEVLDRAARRIVMMAGPFQPFPPAVRSEVDILSITRVWTFTRSDELVAE
jgi:protein TonB